MIYQNNITREFAPEEVKRIDEFRQEKDTSVLVVMFTDLKGSTEIAELRGEDYANKLRKRHNDILLEIIERNRQGLYIKNIGDAIMAVFSEPSVAVERALEIQRALYFHNKKNPSDQNIIVRIGLHMGQVAVEDKTSPDVFGRHVNRAARIESLAGGGHVFISYSVYDSAKGWIKDENIHFTKHGDYLVKGIPEPIQIFEAFEIGITTPKPPSISPVKSKKSKRIILLLVLVCVLIGVITYLFFHVNGSSKKTLGQNPITEAKKDVKNGTPHKKQKFPKEKAEREKDRKEAEKEREKDRKEAEKRRKRLLKKRDKKNKK